MPNTSIISFESADNHRIKYIDLLRGLCMVLIVWYHTDHPNILNATFYNSTLFFVSGILFKPTGWAFFFKKKIKHLFIPFLFFYITYYFFLVVLNILKYHSVTNTIAFSIFDLFRWYKDFDGYTCNYPLWFIWSLVWIQIMTNYTIRYFNNLTLFFLAFSVSVIGFIFIQHIPTPFMIGRATTFIVYFITGYLLKESIIRNYHENIILLASLIIWLVLLVICNYPTIPLLNVSFLILKDIAFSVFLLYLCKCLQNFALFNAISFIGMNSIIVFGIHDMYLTILRIFIQNVAGEMSILLGFIHWVITIILIVPTIYILNRKFPTFVGK